MVHPHNLILGRRIALVAVLLFGSTGFCRAQEVMPDDVAHPARPVKVFKHAPPPVAPDDPVQAAPGGSKEVHYLDEPRNVPKEPHNLVQEAFLDHDMGAIIWVSVGSVPILICLFLLLRQRLHERWRRRLSDDETELEYEYMDSEEP